MTEKKKILVIDDEEMHLYTAKGLLESDGVEVSTYRGAFGATNSVKAVQPDLILMDVNMPGLSGENLVSLIKPYSDEKKIPILFYSSNDEAMLRDLVAIHGVRGYVCKGDLPTLFQKVGECLAQAA
jgi:CheY-like chemotaxis protein